MNHGNCNIKTTESIQVFYRNIGQIGVKGYAKSDLPDEDRRTGFDFYHKYIVYTDSDGNQYATTVVY